MPWLPQHQFLDWPQDAADLTTDEIIALYESGHAGCKYSPEAWEQFHATQPHADGDEVAHRFNLAETGAGKLVAPFVHVLEMFPGCWPGIIGQGTGDCVSWGTRNASLGTMVCDILTGQPDEKTGVVEGRPEVSQEAISHGVLATETFYWHRGHGGQGWHCPAAATIATSVTGAVLRQNYPEASIDLTKYSVRTATAYGSRKPSQNLIDLGSKRLIHAATNARSFESRRDLLHNGYFLLDCGGEGYSSERDANGVSRRKGNWAHSMGEIAVDDRDVIKQLYNESLVLILNSWAKWNRGPRDIYQSASLVPAAKKELWTRLGIINPATGNIMIPEGSMWVRWSECSRREAIAMSGISGFPAREVPLDFMM